MNSTQIRELLEKYFAGESSLDEEQLLRIYFNGNQVEESLEPYRALFQFFQREKTEHPGENFDETLFRRIAAESGTSTSLYARIRALRPWLMRAAVLAFLIAGSWWVFNSYHPGKPGEVAAIDWSRYEPESPEEAFRITQEALGKVSKNLNRGSSIAAGEISRLGEMGKVLY